MSADEKNNIKTEHVDTVDNAAITEFDYCESQNGQQGQEQKGSSFLAYFNVVCVVAGTGMLGLPYALRQGGWCGLLILFLAWVMSIYTGIILIRCLYANGKYRLSSFKEVATVSFGAIGGWVTFFFHSWVLLGAPVLYLVLAGDNINSIAKGTPAELTQTTWIIISCASVTIPIVVVKTLKDVAWISALGMLTAIIVVLIVLAVACIHQSSGVIQNVHYEPVIWDQFPIALATISFSFSGNVVYPHVEASMRRPKNWPKVVAAGLTTCALMYFLVAVPGYYIYGDEVETPIYDSIPPETPRTVAVIMMTLHVLLSCPLLITSFSLDVEEMLNISVERFGKWKEFAIRATFRIFIVVMVGVVACVVPHFGSLMSLIGAFASCALIFILPVCCYFRLTGFRNKRIYEIVWCLLIVVVGVVGLIFGTKDSIQGLIAAFNEP
ncbi:hypothetical protein DFQ28_004601 [Apophysomyces sp. BC1034]|nr:hypothetical protein DFQ30_001705 [Apophysomyces sp. BC1015]KAG0180323.1 hypothetical protein DFQ29_000897 [Apophysomyces sp. BC1021]KAG0188614.1 hypothetical protein DFQ28_004601 [Apophysomyces sp. BC1034]